MSYVGQNGRRLRSVTSGVSCLVVIGLTTFAAAQDGPWLTEPRSGEQLLGEQFLSFAQMSLNGPGEPTAGQILRSQVLFDLALELIPDDGELWRLRSELANLQGDQAAQTHALRQYARSRPTDDAVQLQLFLTRIEREQTLDERSTVIARLLQSPKAKNLSLPLRSRLASYAAAAAQEIGNRKQFAKWIKRALKWDPANASAAAMTYQYTLQRSNNPAHIGAALINWVRTDPTDPTARIELARQLQDQAAYSQATEQYEMFVQLTRSPLDEGDWSRYLIARAAAGQSEIAMSSIDQTQRAMEDAAAEDKNQDAEQNVARTSLPIYVQIIRLAIVATGGDTERATALFNELQTSIDEPTDEITRDLLRVAASLGLGEAALDDDLAPFDDWDALDLAKKQSDPAARIKALTQTAQHWPDRVPGMIAALLLLQDHAPVEPSPIGQSLIQLMTRTPKRVWYRDLSLSPWVVMRLTVHPPRTRYLETIEVVISLRNTSGVPLSLTTQGPIPTRIWLTIEPSIAGQSLGPQQPIVVDLARQLTLGAGETLTLRVRLDRTPFGGMIASHPATTLTWRMSAILDPRPNAYGTAVPGPIGGQASAHSLFVYGLPVTTQNIDLWLEQLDSPTPATQMRSAAHLLHAINNLPSELSAESTRTVRQQITDAINNLYTQGSPVQQAWICRFLLLAGDHATAFDSVTHLAERSDDPMIRLLYLLTVVQDATSDALMSALRHTNPTISQFAQALREAIEQAEAAAEEAEALSDSQ